MIVEFYPKDYGVIQWSRVHKENISICASRGDLDNLCLSANLKRHVCKFMGRAQGMF